MGFIASYKRLEKLCGELLGDDRRVSAYIDKMTKIPNACSYVKTWDDDLKKLKHYRYIRNKIAHEVGCTEQNMCKSSDVLWLNNFCSRIAKKTDPLSMYIKAGRSMTSKKTNSNKNTVKACKKRSKRKKNKRTSATLIVFVVLIIALLTATVLGYIGVLEIPFLDNIIQLLDNVLVL